MKKRQLALIGISLALTLPWMGCKKSGGTIKAGPPPTGPVELKLKWPVGSRLVQDFDIQQTTETFVPAMPAPMKQDMTMGQKYALSVLKERTDGGREVEMEFLSLRLKVQSGGRGVVDYDSSRKASGNDPVAGLLQNLVGAKIRFFLDASNEVWKVEGVDEMQKRFAGGQNDPTGMMKSMFSEDYFKQMMNYNKGLPSKPVAPGDTWPLNLEISMGELGTLVIAQTYTFKSWEKRDQHNCARLAFDGTVKGKTGQGLKISGMSVSIEEGASSGETWFDLERGTFVNTTINQDMKMLLTMPNQAQGNTAPGARSQIITNLLHQVITIQLEPD